MNIIKPDYRTVGEAVFNYVQEAILNGYYKPGERLIQEEIAELLNVSRIPVREAFQRLHAEGLVDIVSHKCTTVASFTIDDLEDIYMMRELLEVRAGILATRNFSKDLELEMSRALIKMNELAREKTNAETYQKLSKANREFHMAIGKGSGSKRLYQSLHSLWSTTPNYGVTYRIQSFNKTHEEILKAMKKKDEKVVAELLKIHIESSKHRFIEHYKEYYAKQLRGKA